MHAVTKQIIAFNHNRNPALVAIKYKLLAQDVFRFYRGTCHLFYAALANKINWDDNTRCWITGDLHLENFGSYKGDNRVVYFDMNDFDEAIAAPATWEVARLLTSIHLAAQVLKFDEKLADAIGKIYLEAYIKVLQTGKPVVIEKETASGLLAYFLQQVALRSQKKFVHSKIEYRKGAWQLIIDNKKALLCPAPARQKVMDALSHWLTVNQPTHRLRVLDACYRVAGTGSVGIERYAVLLQDKEAGRFHLLDVKEAKASALAEYSPYRQPKWATEAERVVSLQKIVQHVSPAFLQTLVIGDKSFVVKELQPVQDRMDLTLCKGKKDKLAAILITMAQVTASGQLRSGGRQKSSVADDMIAFAQNHETWKTPVLKYAKAYAKQVMKDYNSYCLDYKRSQVR